VRKSSAFILSALVVACALSLAASPRAPAQAGQGGAGAAAPKTTAPKAAEPDITFVDEPESPPTDTPARNPFGDTASASSRTDAVPGCVELSTGLKVPGLVYTTRAKRLKIFNLERKVYEYVPVAACKKIEAVLEWERLDKEWRFKEAGNTEKVYTGRSYPLRMLSWRLTLRNDHAIVGHILGQPLYAEHNGKAERFILHQRDKGAMGGKLEDLVYITRVDFGPEAYNRAVDELKAKAEAAAATPDAP
jgi:hypothetical protein